MADHDAGDGWDLIVTPWHLDEHIPAFPVPVGMAETIRPSLPDSSVPTSSTARNCPACASLQAPGPSITQIGECLAAVCATAD